MTAQESTITSGPSSGGSKSVPRLEGIRGVFALGVVTYHVAYTAGISIDGGAKGLVATLLNGLQVCLAPFFVLSGMLLYRRFAYATLTGTKQPASMPFYAKRALRILPAYWAMIIVLLLTLNLHSIDSVWYVLNPLLLVHFVTITDFSHWIIGTEPTWTVPTEALYYLLLPVIALVAGRYARRVADPARRARRMLVPIGLFGVVGLVWNAFAFWPSNAARTYYYNFWPFGFFSVVAAGMALGVLTAYADATGRTPSFYRFVQKRPNACWLVALGFFLLALPTPFGKPGTGDYGALTQQLVSHVLLLAFAVAVIAPLSVPDVRSRLMDATLTNLPIRFVGRLSYAIYLWHVALIHFWFQNGNIFGNDPVPVYTLTGKVGFWELEAFVVVGCVLVALASRYLVEQPAVRLRNRLFPAERGSARPVQAEPMVAQRGEPTQERKPEQQPELA